MRKMKKSVFIALSCIIILVSLIVFSVSGSCEETNGNTLYVGGSEEGSYEAIQDSINASLDGDTIYVYAGTYYEALVIDRSINLIGENKATTIVNGKDRMDVVTINSDWINISGFTVTDGLITGILIENADYCNIFQNNINNNEIGISMIASRNSNIFNNTFYNNSQIGLQIVNMTIIDFYLSRDNSIFLNNFLNNKQSTFDDCINNWHYLGNGNYYDNYLGLDKNNDGIGDTSYEIPGGNNMDEYPLMVQYDGQIRLKSFYVDDGPLYKMLIIGLIVASIFVLPIGYFWYRKYYKKK